MAYLIRSKGRGLVMRDPSIGKMLDVGVKDFVEFGDLPPGIGATGDADVEVKEIVSSLKKKKTKDIEE